MFHEDKAARYMDAWRNDWCRFARDVLKCKLDSEQEDILHSVQVNPLTAVKSGTARGKDFVAACGAVCFMYLTPRWEGGQLIKNTKVALTAPTGRQVSDIMIPEVSRLLKKAPFLPGRLLSNGIRTNYNEWFLVGFKSGEDNTEAWSGFHAANTMFVVTEASGISETIYNAIEGNLQGNSRLLIVFNPNVTTGYAAQAMKSERFAKFTLNSLNAINVKEKREVIPGQVNYEWVKDKVENWCSKIRKEDYNEGEGDFVWENGLYRPNDLFRVKVLGMFPKASADCLIPYEWVELAFKRYRDLEDRGFVPKTPCRLGVDVAGMGRDDSVLCERYDNYVPTMDVSQSAGVADHMNIAGKVALRLQKKGSKAFIDTIGEGAGVYSRLLEQGYINAYSCKFSEGASRLHDITGVYTFANMRAYCYWAVRDWLNPKNGFEPAIAPDDRLMEDLTEVKWKFQSNGSIIIEPKEDLIKRLKRSPDRADALANTFYPRDNYGMSDEQILSVF